jgi:hypothetical protein
MYYVEAKAIMLKIGVHCSFMQMSAGIAASAASRRVFSHLIAIIMR